MSSTSRPLRAALVVAFAAIVAGPLFSSGAEGAGVSYRDAVLADAPVAYWRLGDAAGVRAADELRLRAGRYRPGTLLGAPGALPGDADTAAVFDGRRGSVDVPRGAPIDPRRGVTVELWLRRGPGGGARTVFVHRAPGRGVFRGVVVAVDGVNRVRAVLAGPRALVSVTSRRRLDRAWHHVVVTDDRVATRLYVDGVEAAARARSAGLRPHRGSIRLGRPLGAGRGFAGALDEVAVYTRALPAARVAVHHSFARATVTPVPDVPPQRDAAAPLVTLAAPAPGAWTSDTTPLVAGTAGTQPGDGDAVTVHVTAAGSPAPAQVLNAVRSPTGAFAVETAELADGTYTAHAQQADDAANVGISPTVTFHVDTRAPAVTLSGPSGSVGGPAVVAGTAGGAEGDSAIVDVEIYAGATTSGAPVRVLSAVRAPGGAFSVAVPGLENGAYAVRAGQSDAAGNRAWSATLTFQLRDPVLLGAGDIAGCWSGGILPGSLATAALLDRFPGDVVQTFGDNAYDHGTAADFANCYEPTWGRARTRTRPAIGDHEYDLSPLAPGYFAYFAEQLAPFGASASDPARAYYSYDLGAWHVAVLNGACHFSTTGCDVAGQASWFDADLAAHPNTCTAVVSSSPRFSSGNVHGSNPAMQTLWQIAYDRGAELWLSGDEHVYERFAPMNAAGALDPARGVRQITVGTGGYQLYGLGTRHPHSVAFNGAGFGDTNGDNVADPGQGDAFGVIRLTLREASYDWAFVPEAGRSFPDAGTGDCH